MGRGCIPNPSGTHGHPYEAVPEIMLVKKKACPIRSQKNVTMWSDLGVIQWSWT